MQTHLSSLNSRPSILECSNDEQGSSIIGSIQTCIVIRNIGSSIGVRIPSLNQHGIVSSANLTDETYEDLQQVLNSFTPGQKLQ